MQGIDAGVAPAESLDQVEKQLHSLLRASNEMLGIAQIMREKLTGEAAPKDPGEKTVPLPEGGRIPALLRLSRQTNTTIEACAGELAHVSALL